MLPGSLIIKVKNLLDQTKIPVPYTVSIAWKDYWKTVWKFSNASLKQEPFLCRSFDVNEDRLKALLVDSSRQTTWKNQLQPCGCF